MMELSSLSISKIQQGLKNKTFSAQEITESYLNNIKALNSQLNAFISVFDKEAIEQAQRIDGLIAKDQKLPSLAGIPIAIKDNILVFEQKATAGSKILDNYIAPYDATVIKKIKEQGAIILGKTNLDEFAMGASGEHSAYGATKNPNDLEYSPGGSSSGSAVAVASDLANCALGSDTAGSVRQPASFCGVVGMKPTYGAVSRYGLIAMTSSLDQIGPISKTVEDAEIIFNSIKGRDKMDSTSYEQKVEQDANFNPKKLRIGVMQNFLNKRVQPEILDIMRNSIKKLEKEGFTIEEVSLPHLEYGIACYYILMPAEVSSNLARYDGIRFGMSDLEGQELTDLSTSTRGKFFGEETKRRIMLGTYCLSAGYYDAYYLKAQKIRAKIIEDFKKVFQKIDLLFLPTSPFLPFKLGEKLLDPLSMYMADLLTVPANLAGLPAISIPTSKVGKLPVGFQFIGPPFEEKRMFSVAKVFEKII